MSTQAVWQQSSVNNTVSSKQNRFCVTSRLLAFLRLVFLLLLWFLCCYHRKWRWQQMLRWSVLVRMYIHVPVSAFSHCTSSFQVKAPKQLIATLYDVVKKWIVDLVLTTNLWATWYSCSWYILFRPWYICYSPLVPGRHICRHSRCCNSCCSVIDCGKYQCKSWKHVFADRCEQVVFVPRRANYWNTITNLYQEELLRFCKGVCVLVPHHTFVSLIKRGSPIYWFPSPKTQTMHALSLPVSTFFHICYQRKLRHSHCQCWRIIGSGTDRQSICRRFGTGPRQIRRQRLASRTTGSRASK